MLPSPSLPAIRLRWYLIPPVTTVLIYAKPDLEPNLHSTLFSCEDLERYLAERAEDARMLLFSTEPHVLVVDRTCRAPTT